MASISFPKIILQSVIIMFLLFMLMASSCKPTRMGCTNREVKYVQKHFAKLVNKCSYETHRQSLLFFPFLERDSTSEILVKGRDTFWRESAPVPYDCDKFIKERDSLLKLGIKTDTKAIVKCPDCPYTVDTLKKYKEVIKEDSRKLLMKDAEIAQLKKDCDAALQEKDKRIAELQKKLTKSLQAEAKSKGKLTVFYWAIGILLGGLSIGFLIKKFKPKIPFVG